MILFALVLTLGKAVTSADDLFDALAAWTDGTLTVKIVKGSEERSVNVSA